MTLTWQFLAFDALGNRDIHDMLRLRSEVFVLEQSCLFLDIDGLDPEAMHLLGHDEQHRLSACARCFAPGRPYAQASIGRVVTAPHARGQGLGQVLMRQALSSLWAHWGRQPVRIGAQAHLQGFYGRLGFRVDGEPYLEDGIPHVQMLHPGEPDLETAQRKDRGPAAHNHISPLSGDNPC